MKLNKNVIGAFTNTLKEYTSMLFDIATELGEFFGSTLGNGMVKLVEDPQGNFNVTSDGTTLINELHLRYRHPIASLLLEAGDCQGKNHGDLTKGTIVLACSLVIAGLELMEQGLHPNVVKQGFNTALRVVLDNLDRLKQDFSLDADSIKENMSAFLAQKLSKPAARHLGSITADPLLTFVQRMIRDGDWTRLSIDELMAKLLDEIVMIIHTEGQITDSFVMNGASISKKPLSWKERWNDVTITRLHNLRIAMLSGELYLDKKKLDHVQLSVNSIETQSQFRAGLEDAWIEKARALVSMGVNVLITEKGIDDALVSAVQVGKMPVLIFRRAKMEEMKRVAKHVHATIVNDITSLEAIDLGHADFIRPQPMRKDIAFVFVNKSEPRHLELVITGSIYSICDAVKHHVTSALKTQIRAIHGGMIDGYPIVLEDIAKNSRVEIHGHPGSKSNLACNAFLDAMEGVARRAAINEGKDYIEVGEFTRSMHSIPVESVASMIDIATITACKLLGVDGLVINEIGWKKRTGTQPHHEKEHPQQGTDS
ncbi:MAG TPA: TCP-1/cpn60 chaperonin family protein [Candidatus Lokiarchaeia archaeon]|nr:TCP-1/cpn60 chaperonin family protein [Candidatus Lokiarchaeia archaeon]